MVHPAGLNINTERIDHIYQDRHINGVRLLLRYGDIADSTNLIWVATVVRCRPS
jgi:GDP-D-mannose dehydratase